MASILTSACLYEPAKDKEVSIARTCSSEDFSLRLTASSHYGFTQTQALYKAPYPLTFKQAGVVCAVALVILVVVCISLVRGEFREVYHFDDTLPNANSTVAATSSSIVHDVEKRLNLEDKAVHPTTGLSSEEAV